MGRKPKVDIETKLYLVESYLKGKISFSECLEIYNLSKNTFRNWVYQYRYKGKGSFITPPKNKKYDTQFKENVVLEYLNNSKSLNEVCLKYNISSIGLLYKWIKDYNNHKSLKPKTRRKTNMIKAKKTTLSERIKLVEKCIENNLNYNLIAREDGVTYNQIYSWVRKYKEKGEIGLKDNRGKAVTELSQTQKMETKIKELEAKNKFLKMENDYLKKLEELERQAMQNQK